MISSLFSISALLALVCADAGFLTVPFNRVPVNTTSGKTAIKNTKVDSVPEVLRSGVYQYMASFEIAGQPQTASIDTGSADLWVNGPKSGQSNSFDPSNSRYVNDGFEIGYVDGSGASGNYYVDKITWGSSTIDAQFAVSDKQQQGQATGVFGIGFNATEASKDGPYSNYPQALKEQGVIESVAYSLYLDDVNSPSGTLLFGAVDTSRFEGSLKLLDITSTSSLNVDFEVAGHKLNGVLDSGTSLTYLPDDIVAGIAHSFGATYNNNAGAWQANGDVPEGGVTYNFGGKEITVPKSELWLEMQGSGKGHFLTIMPYSQAGNYVLLGDTFLRSAYVVYDLEAAKIAIAQANWNAGSPNYQTITSSGIPGAE